MSHKSTESMTRIASRTSRGPFVVIQQAAKPRTPTDTTLVSRHDALDQFIPEPLMIALPLIVLDKVAHSPSEVALADWTATVTRCGRICWQRRKINLSTVFVGQSVGVTQVGDRIWLVTFMQYDLGYFDDETCRL